MSSLELPGSLEFQDGLRDPGCSRKVGVSGGRGCAACGRAAGRCQDHREIVLTGLRVRFMVDGGEGAEKHTTVGEAVATPRGDAA